MEVIAEEVANVTVGSHSRNVTLTVTVPVLTNVVALRGGEQLHMEVAPKATSSKRKSENWRTDATVPKGAAVKGAAGAAGKRDRSHGRRESVEI